MSNEKFSKQMSEKKIEEIKKLMDDVASPNQLQLDSNMRLGTMAGKSDSTGFNGTDLFKALSHKNVIYDRENDRILALSDNHGVGEVDKAIQITVIDSARKFFESIKKHVENHRGTDEEYSRISELLVTMEYINASSIHIPQFKELKKQVNSYLKKEYDKVPEDRKGKLDVEFLKLFSASKASIPRGIFKVGKYKISNENEKEVMRKEYIIELLNDGVLDFEFLDSSGIIEEFSFDEVEYFLKNNPRISKDQYEIAACNSSGCATREELLEMYLESDKKFLVNFATDEEIAKFITEGKLSLSEYARRIRVSEVPNFDKELLVELYSMSDVPKNASYITYAKDGQKSKIAKGIEQRLTGDKLLAILSSDKVKYENALTSEEFIEMYGKVSVEDLISLESMGYVDSKDIIKVLKFKSLKSTNPEEYSNNERKVRDFYTLSKLEEIIKSNDGKLPERFVINFNQMLKEMPEEENKKYFEKIFEELKQKEAGQDETLIRLISSKVDVRKNMGYSLDLNVVENMYLDEKITFEDVIPMYNLGYVDIDCLKDMFTQEELKENYENGNFGLEAMTLLQDKEEFLAKELEDKKVSIDDIIRIYSQSKILDVNSLKQILAKQNLSEVSIGEMLPDETPKEKVEELFMNFFISHDDISNLVSRNMITKEEADEYAKRLTTHENFQELFREGNGIVKLTRDSHTDIQRITSSREKLTNQRPSQVKIDPLYKETFLDTLGFEEDNKLLLAGTNNSLDGYTLCPNEELGLVVFINTDRTQNATYVMSMSQGMYWLTKIKREFNVDGRNAQIESQATKGKLRETEHIKVRNDSAGWGKNMLDDMLSLSPELRGKIKDEKYKNQVDEIVDDIKTDYNERKTGAR